MYCTLDDAVYHVLGLIVEGLEDFSTITDTSPRTAIMESIAKHVQKAKRDGPEMFTDMIMDELDIDPDTDATSDIIATKIASLIPGVIAESKGVITYTNLCNHEKAIWNIIKDKIKN